MKLFFAVLILLISVTVRAQAQKCVELYKRAAPFILSKGPLQTELKKTERAPEVLELATSESFPAVTEKEIVKATEDIRSLGYLLKSDHDGCPARADLWIALVKLKKSQVPVSYAKITQDFRSYLKKGGAGMGIQSLHADMTAIGASGEHLSVSNQNLPKLKQWVQKMNATYIRLMKEQQVLMDRSFHENLYAEKFSSIKVDLKKIRQHLLEDLTETTKLRKELLGMMEL